MAKFEEEELQELKDRKSKQLKEFLDAQPPEKNGEDLLRLWEQLYDSDVQGTSVKTLTGPSDDDTNPVYPYEKLQAIVGDAGNWKYPRMWQRFDEIERRGEAYREGEVLNFKAPNKNPEIVAQNVLIVGGGPIGIRMGIELVMGGHNATIVEKRREIKNEDGSIKQLGFTNRINRPHMWNFVRNDLAKLNGKDFMSRQAAYPVFTEPETSSVGIDELQCLMMKSALLLGVDFRLGVGYVNASVTLEDKTCRPSWDVQLNYDAEAAEKFGKSLGKTSEVFDCLVGCDGPRSTVRETQGKYFGEIDKRKFMDAVGIVANVQKIKKKRLEALGFEHGQDPGDMNRDKMVFKKFFADIQAEAEADLESLIYYKASFHNYCILVPKRADMMKHGLSGKVYSFHQGRDGKGAQEEEKEKLKAYVRRILNAAKIPIDPEASNGGFVGVPNDCMAFDFAECWNTKKSLHFNLPPANYDTDEDGEWEGKKLVPLVALAGDALLEPFWPMGLGLKRGWQAIMDTVYCIDNLYSAQHFVEKKGVNPDDWSWEDHYEALREQCAKNFEYNNRMQVSSDLKDGEYPDKGIIMVQLRKKLKDAEKPPFEVEVDPWTRYEPLAKEVGSKINMMPADEKEKWLHPIVKRALALKEYYDEVSKGGKSGEIEYRGKELISINGRVTGGYKQMGRRSVTSTGSKPSAKAKAGPMGIGAIMGGGKPPPKGIGAIMGGGPPKGIGAIMGGAAKQGTAFDQGSMAAIMMGGMGKKPMRKVEADEDEAPEDPEKTQKLEEVRERIKTLTKQLEEAKAEERELLAS